MRFVTPLAVLVALALCALLPALAADQDFQINSAQRIDWQPGPDSLPAGAEAAVLSGDPGTEGPFVMRFKFPADYRVAWHTHPITENLTLISGTAKHQTKMDDAAVDIAPGDFIYLPKNTAHTIWTTDEPAVIQLTAVGPFKIEYLDASDDPRKME